jgi:hypothetical protein
MPVVCPRRKIPDFLGPDLHPVRPNHDVFPSAWPSWLSFTPATTPINGDRGACPSAFKGDSRKAPGKLRHHNPVAAIPTVANTRRKAATKRTTTVRTLRGSHSDQWRATRAMRRRPCLGRTAVVAPVRRCNAPARKYLPNRGHRIRRPDRTLRPPWVAPGTHLPRRWRRADTASFANTRPLAFPAACMLH